MPVDADELAERVAKMTREWLAFAETHYGKDEFHVGDVGIAFDLHFEDGSSAVAHTCSDWRDFATAGLFRAAMQNVERPS